MNKPGWAPVKLPQTGKYSSYRYSIFSSSSYGPTFTGGGGDIYISNYASSNSNSLSNLDYTYSPPSGYSQGSTFAQTFLAGTYKFTPDEVETFYETNWKITMHFLISIPLVVNLLVVFTKHSPVKSWLSLLRPHYNLNTKYISSDIMTRLTNISYALRVFT